jgi:TPR repeat protein
MEEPDIPRGFLHYNLAALGGNPLAQMALAYRFGHGVGVKQDCETALIWYKKVADKVAAKIRLTGTPSVQRIRIPDEIVNCFPNLFMHLFKYNCFFRSHLQLLAL